ncbi:MAG: carboxypeptidase regulatory-like domain-containing protein [Candidatus Methylomirabilales bacterium]
MIAPVGSPIIILNTDNFLHTFHTISVKNPPVDKAQPNLRKVLKEKFDKPEIIEVNCDLHPWMKAWIVVAEHPYYTVTDGTGAFVLTDVPAGSYQLRVWHETLGQEAKDVVVNVGAEANVTFELMKK